MQRPTHPRLHVRDARDAHTVFEAVRKGLLRPVERRLNEIERSTHIRSGAIFVWEESDDELGLKRWTDGRVWSQSRMREPYLFYDERLPSEPYYKMNDRSGSPTYHFVDGVSRGGSSSAMSHYNRSSQQPMGLVKQAYSAWVLLAPNSRPRKWHLTAYFTYSDLPTIPSIDQDPALRKITVPAGIYRSGKARSRNSSGAPPDYRSTSSWAIASMPQPSMGSTHYPLYPPPSPRQGECPTPMLPSIHNTIAEHNAHTSQSPSRGTRPAEDQRVIQILNSRHIR